VAFYPIDITNEESLDSVLAYIDTSLQFGEDDDVKTKDYE
jgi:hypothetical protein